MRHRSLEWKKGYFLKDRGKERVIRSNNLKNTIEEFLNENQIQKVFVDRDETSHNMKEVISILKAQRDLEIIDI